MEDKRRAKEKRLGGKKDVEIRREEIKGNDLRLKESRRVERETKKKRGDVIRQNERRNKVLEE